MNREPGGEDVRAHYAALAQDYARGANKACEAAYRHLVRRTTRDATAVLEIGCGAMPHIAASGAPVRIGCDFSGPMLRAAPPTIPLLQADGARLPFADGSFDAVVTINVLEHVPGPAALLDEAARVLRPGGTLAAVTPNGNLAWLLEALERLRLKLPEGPHRFLTHADLRAYLPRSVDIEEHQPFLAFPAGPAWLVDIAESVLPFGLFQCLVAKKT